MKEAGKNSEVFSDFLEYPFSILTNSPRYLSGDRKHIYIRMNNAKTLQSIVSLYQEYTLNLVSGTQVIAIQDCSGLKIVTGTMFEKNSTKHRKELIEILGTRFRDLKFEYFTPPEGYKF